MSAFNRDLSQPLEDAGSNREGGGRAGEGGRETTGYEPLELDASALRPLDLRLESSNRAEGREPHNLVGLESSARDPSLGRDDPSLGHDDRDVCMRDGGAAGGAGCGGGGEGGAGCGGDEGEAGAGLQAEEEFHLDFSSGVEGGLPRVLELQLRGRVALVEWA